MKREQAIDPVCRATIQGFTLIEVLISIVVITVGLIALLGAFGVSLAAMQTSEQDMIAKQLAQEMMESVITARQTANITWDQIQNKNVGNGIFVNGLYPINKAGPDGIFGTDDDAGAGAETMQNPGPDGIVGTADDPAPTSLTSFQRSIQITNTASSNLRNVTITIQYITPGRTKNYVLAGMISQYR